MAGMLSASLPAAALRQIAAACAVATLIAIAVSFAAVSAVHGREVDNAEARATTDSAHIAHIFYYSVWAPIQQQIGDVTFAEAAHPDIMSAFSRRSTFGLSIVGLRAWSLDGELLWSNDARGSTAAPADGWRSASNGTATSRFADGAPYTDLQGNSRTGPVVRTWVPFRDQPADGPVRGSVVGVLEIVRDVTSEIGHGGFTAAWLPAFSSAVAVLAGWFAIGTYRSRDPRSLTRLVKQQQKRIETLEMQRTQSAKLATVGETVAGVAHEINNPLTTIWGLSQLALEKDLDEKSRIEMQMIHDEAQRTAKIVQNLLSFARARESELALTSINAAVDAAVELRRYQLRVNNISISVEADPDLPRTMADPFKIQQVVLNLIVNAEQAIANSHRGGRILVRTLVKEARIHVIVEDDGPGIPENARASIFNPFFTTKGEGQGTGLGLSICLSIVQEHGGSMTAENGPYGGTSMVVELPITDQTQRNEHALAGARSSGR